MTSLYIIITIISMIFAFVYFDKFVSMYNNNCILKNWIDTIIVIDGSPCKIDKWSLSYDVKGKYYKFESKNKLIIDEKIFINKYDAFKHLEDLVNKKMILNFYISTHMQTF